MPRVSVVIPAYNAEQFLGETIESVLAQSFDDFEVIIVNDGSTDSTAEVIRQYATRDARIRPIAKENGGPASARNVGIGSATGKYVAFNDADDLWCPGKLMHQTSFFDRQPDDVGMVYTDAKKFDDQGAWILPAEMRWHYASGDIYTRLIEDNFIPNQSVMVRRNCFENVGLFDESKGIVEDYDMWLRLAKAYKVGFLDKVLSLYREHAAGISKRIERSLKANIYLFQKHNRLFGQETRLQLPLRKAMGKRYFQLGYYYLRQGRMAEARAQFDLATAHEFAVSAKLKSSTYFPLWFLKSMGAFQKMVRRPPQISKSADELKRLMQQSG